MLQQQRLQRVILFFLMFWGGTHISYGQAGAPDNFQPVFTSETGKRMVTKTVVQPDGKIILAGNFASASTGAASGIARVNPDGTVDTSFQIGTGARSIAGGQGIILDVALQGDKILVCGDFGNFNEVPVGGFVRLNANGSIDTSFTPPDRDGIITAVAVTAQKILIGGRFTRLNTQTSSFTRRGIASLNSNGTIDMGFDPGNGFFREDLTKPFKISKIIVTSIGIMVGGNFEKYQQVIRNGLVRILANGNVDTGFPGLPAQGIVEDIFDLGGGHVLIGGDFQFYTNAVRLARLNPDGTLENNFTTGAGPNGPVKAVLFLPTGKILVAGAFTQYNNQSTGSLIRINGTGSLDTDFTSTQIAFPQGAAFVNCLATRADSGKIVFGGSFTAVNGVPRGGYAQLNAGGPLDVIFPNLNVSNIPNSVTRTALRSDGKMVVVGDFDGVNGALRKGLALLDTNGTLDVSFQSDVAVGSIKAIATDGLKTYIGGDFTTVNGVSQNRLARLNPNGTLDTEFSGGDAQDGPVSDLVVLPDSKVIIVGSFTSYRGSPCFRIARLLPTGAVDPSFAAGTGADDGKITRIVRQSDGKLVVIGEFNSFAGASRHYVARLNDDGSLDAGFVDTDNPLSDFPNSVAVQGDGKIVVVQQVTMEGAVSRILRFERNGNPDISFNNLFSLQGGIQQVAVQPDGKLVVAGTFTTFRGVSRNSLARLNPNGSVDLTFNPGNGLINDIVGLTLSDLQVTQGNIVAVGNFFIYNGTLRYGLVRIPTRPNKTTPGVFRPSNGFFYLRNSLTEGFADREFFYGSADDIPVVGDWDGDGVKTVGIYRNGVFYLRNSNSGGFADIQFSFGAPGDIPIAGDWNGDGIDTIGVVRNGRVFLRNSNSAGPADLDFFYGAGTDIPIAGDWNGDGIDTIGVYRPATGYVYLRNSNTTGFADLEFPYGQAGDKPVVGDWNGDGTDTIGIVRNGQWFLRNSNNTGFADIQFFYGLATDTPITGDWDGLP